MKNLTSRILKSTLSVLIVVSMLMGMCTTLFAEGGGENQQPNIKYVSLGASNTNGYGIRGYLPDDIIKDPLAADKSKLNVYGYNRAPEDAYPYQVAQALKLLTGRQVDLTQLAISSMRVEEVRMLLDDEYYGDEYTRWRFYDEAGNGWFAQAETQNGTFTGEQALANLRASYKKAIKEADYISVDMGLNNFGVFAFNNIKTIMADGNYWKKPDFSQIMDVDDQLKYEILKALVNEYFSENLDPELAAKLDKVADTLVYAALGFCYNFDIVMQEIYALNPDAEVIVVSIQNMLHGISIDFEGVEIPLGDIYGELIDLVNMYTASGSPFADSYRFAYAGENGHATTFRDELREWNGDPESLSENVKDCFDMYDDNLYVRSIIEYMLVGQALAKVFKEIKDLTGAAFKDDSYNLYFDVNSINLSTLDLKNPPEEFKEYVKKAANHLSYIRNLEVKHETKKAVLPDEYETEISKISDEYKSSASETLQEALYMIYDAYNYVLNYAYDVVATVVQEALTIDVIKVGTDSMNGFNSEAGKLMQYISGEVVEGATQNFMYKMGEAPMPYEFEMDDTLFDDPAIAAIAVLASCFELGNSFFAHPNEKGHDEITGAILSAIRNGSDGDAFTSSKINTALSALMQYTEENYPKAYETLMQAAEYFGSEEFMLLCEELGNLYKKLDSATTPDQKARLLEAIGKLLTSLQAIAAKATAKKYEVTESSYYVSIGDSSFSGYGLPGYIPGVFTGEEQIIGNEAPVLLAKKLFGEDYAGSFKKLDKGGLRVDDLLVWLGDDSFIDDYYNGYTISNMKHKDEPNPTKYYQNLYISEIQKADLITLAVGGGNATTFVGEQMDRLAKDPSGALLYEMDWSKYLGDYDMSQIRGYIDAVQVAIEDKLPEIDGVPAGKMLEVVAESFVYGFVGYATNYTKLVERIHEINPEAHLVIVGYFNPIDPMYVPFDINGKKVEIPVGSLANLFIEPVNASSLAYALAHKSNTTYVSISEATTVLDEDGVFDYETVFNSVFAAPDKIHAGKKGHQYVANQIYMSIEKEYTSEEISTEVLMTLLDFVSYLAEEFGDEAYAYAYDVVADAGYINTAINAIDEVIAILENIDLSETQMTEEFKNKLTVEIAKVVDTLNAAKALILEADEYDAASLAALMNLINEAKEALEFIPVLLNQAGSDIYELAIIPAVEKALYELEYTVIPAAKELAKETAKAIYNYVVDVLAVELKEAIVDAAKKYLPKLADAIYDYLYNNPEEVIEFIKTYGPYAIDVLEEYGDEALAVIGYVLYLYGEDIAALFIENHEVIFANIIAWFEVHGENTAKLIHVYAEALGLCDAVRDEIAKLKAILEDIKAAYDQASPEVKEALDKLIAQIEKQIAKLEMDVEALKAEIAAVIADVQKLIKEGKEIIAQKIAEIKAEVARLKAEAKATMEALKAEAEKAIKDLKEEVVIQLEKALDKEIETIEDLMEALDAKVAEAIDELVAIVNEIIYNATHGTYVIENDSYYLAMGDSSSFGNSYVEMLVDYLDMRKQYNNISVEGATAEDILLSLDEEIIVEILKSDLITISMSNNTFTVFAANQVAAMITGRPVKELNWSYYLSEEAQEKLYEELDSIYASFIESGMEERYADIAIFAIESFLYSYVSYLFSYTELVATIHEINPEALVVLIGMSNTFDGVVMDLGGSEFAIGEYVQNMVDAANLESFAMAIVGDNTVYVHAPDVETNFNVEEVDFLSFIMEIVLFGAENLYANEAGHEYIFGQIIEALEIHDNRGLIGDADRNGIVDMFDASLVLQYYTQEVKEEEIDLYVSDVDGNGEVDMFDASLILQYYTGEIAVFPVEE